jgi:hypothetical protein
VYFVVSRTCIARDVLRIAIARGAFCSAPAGDRKDGTTMKDLEHLEDMEERGNYLPGEFDPAEFDEEMWLEPQTSASREEDLLAIAETPSEWPSHGERIQQDRENPLAEETGPRETEAEAAEEEWTAGMVRPPLDAEARELEEEPIEPVNQPPLKSATEAETEAKYGI